MSTIQMALSIVGGMLIPVSVYGLRRKVTSTTTSEWQMPRCGMPSPDQSLRCKQELGHPGWHEGGTKAWFGECWFVDETVNAQRQRTERPRTEQPPMKKLKAKNPPRRPLTDKEKQEMKACDSGNWRLWDATERQFEYVGKIGTAWKPKAPQPKPENPDIIGPAPIRVRRGMFGTRRTLPNDQARESA